MKFTFSILISLLSLKSIPSKNILFYWGVSGYSHRISVWPLVEKLVDKGHNVTFFSPFPPKKPNSKVTEITPDHLIRDVGLDFNLLNLRVTEGVEAVDTLWRTYVQFAINHCDSVFRNPELVEWINSSSYDLVVINAFFNDCAYGLAHKFKAPYILYGTTSAFGLWSEAFGYPDENYPEFTLHYPIDMTFMQSIWNGLRPLYWHWKRTYQMFPRVEETLRKGLKLDTMPSLSEMEQNVSLVFMNTHYSQEFPRSLPPMFVEIGGMHCVDDIKPLAKDIKAFVESGDEGFIYFSFGTLAKPSTLSKTIQDVIFGAMKKFKIKFLVKWEGEPPMGFPENAIAAQWISQQDVLAHPKIRAFISHGGLLGTQESLCHGVPMIVLPIFADQNYNADIVSARKRGIKLEIYQLTQAQLEDAIREILDNKIYMENTRKASHIFKDRPSKPDDTALWWVEHVLRNKDTSYLRPIGITKNWYQRRMLDIWGVILILILGIFTSIGLPIYYLSSTISKSLKNISILEYKKNS